MKEIERIIKSILVDTVRTDEDLELEYPEKVYFKKIGSWKEILNKLSKAIEQYVIKARIETLEELMIDVNKLPFSVNEKTEVIYESMNERYRLRIAELKKGLDNER